VTVSG
jgi:hypothetical protein